MQKLQHTTYPNDKQVHALHDGYLYEISYEFFSLHDGELHDE